MSDIRCGPEPVESIGRLRWRPMRTLGKTAAATAASCLITAAGSSGAAPAVTAPAPVNGPVLLLNDAGLWTMLPDGTGKRQVLKADKVVDGKFSPDGKRIAFSRDVNGNRDIYTMPASGGAVTRVTTAATVQESPIWSPDGTKLAFLSGPTDGYWGDSVVDVMMLNSTAPYGKAINITQLGEQNIPNPCMGGSETGATGAAWSTDGKTIYTGVECINYTDSDFYGIAYYDVATRAWIRYFDGPYYGTKQVGTVPADVSPDGKRIIVDDWAYFRGPAGTSPKGLSLAIRNVATGAMTKIVSTVTPLGDPSWSPDGLLIVANRNNYKPGSDAYFLRPDGTKARMFAAGFKALDWATR